eukprot:PhM_4_TR3428/c0_g1_i1/m.201
MSSSCNVSSIDDGDDGYGYGYPFNNATGLMFSATTVRRGESNRGDGDDGGPATPTTGRRTSLNLSLGALEVSPMTPDVSSSSGQKQQQLLHRRPPMAPLPTPQKK